MGFFSWLFGPSYEDDYDDLTGEDGYSIEYDRGDRTEKEFDGKHGEHWKETTYNSGGPTYREYDDGTIVKK